MIPSKLWKKMINMRPATELSHETHNKPWHSFNGTCTSWLVAFIKQCIIHVSNRKCMKEGNGGHKE